MKSFQTLTSQFKGPLLRVIFHCQTPWFHDPKLATLLSLSIERAKILGKITLRELYLVQSSDQKSALNPMLMRIRNPWCTSSEALACLLSNEAIRLNRKDFLAELLNWRTRVLWLMPLLALTIHLQRLLCSLANLKIHFTMKATLMSSNLAIPRPHLSWHMVTLFQSTRWILRTSSEPSHINLLMKECNLLRTWTGRIRTDKA